ncbi:MAG: replication factor C small subunit [archaeon]|nr:replication factor C small subunit [archaeon]
MSIKPELPWVEKYRPKKLSEIVGQKEITQRLEAAVKQKNLPNLLFSGPAGVGKTSTAVAIANEMYGEGFQRNFLELNASSDRGIDVVRNTIKDFARTLAFDTDFKIIFLDEADALTSDAQQALRRTMEKYTKTSRFILSVNYSSRIIEPIQSRCVIFRFKPLSAKEMEERLQSIAKIEGLKIDEKAMNAIIYVSQGDMRKSVNILQAAASMDKTINENTIYNVSSRAQPKEIRELINLALDQKFLEARKQLDVLLYEYGMSGEDVMLQLYRELVDFPEKEMNAKTKIDLIDTVGEYNFRLVQGANERIQIEALIAQFMKYKK